MPDKVIAEVILRSANGSSILDATEGITAQTIAKYRIEEQVMKEVSKELKTLGFEIVQMGSVGLTISCSKELFEKVFQTILEVRTKPAMPPNGATLKSTYYQATKPIQIPADLSSLIAGVILPIPAEYFP